MARVFKVSLWTPETAGSASVASVFWEREVGNGHHSSDSTHVKDLKNLVKVRPPGGDHFLVGLCMQMSRNRTSFSLFHDIPFDLRYSPGETVVNVAPKVCVADVAHFVSRLIASRTELSRSFNLFPFSPWSRAVQTSAQASPSSTQSSRLINLSWVHFRLQLVNKNREETHSNRCEDNGDGAKNSLGWRNTRGVLREIQGIDGRIQL